jgi:2-polyprenyl-6-methoxyphenol hydroxylase-like FAD-dependent oxidoreductase
VDEQVDVAVVGAGPTGLLLAGDLAAAGLRCVLLERRTGGSTLTRAFAVHARTLEQFDARAIAEPLLRTGQRVSSLRLLGRARIDLSRLPTRFPFVLVTPQYETERVLRERAVAAGVDLRHGCEVTGLSQDAEGVDLDLAGGRGRLRARFAVGADGVRSSVRRLIGEPFPGRSVVRSVMLADVRLADPPPDVLTVDSTGDEFAFMVPFGDGWYRVIAWDRDHQRPETEPVDPAELRAVVRGALGTDHGMGEPRWISRFHSDERQVPRYRVGRVLLAGDAAHVHSPAGGQGMNTGLQDAANLGWKLAATLAGWAPDGLLDSYQAERHPVGRRVLRTSGGLIRAVMAGPVALPAARILLGAATRLRPVADRATGVVSGLDVRYPAPRGAHRLTGRRAPDVPLAGRGPGPTRLYEALRAGRFVLVAPGAGFARAAAGWSGRLDVVRAGGGSRTAVLVRPDGYVAWALDDADPDRDRGSLRRALAGHCGGPAGAAHGPEHTDPAGPGDPAARTTGDAG